MPRVWYADGSEADLELGRWRWGVSTGPIVENGVYDGEIYDARLEKEGWDEPGRGFLEIRKDWTRANWLRGPGGKLQAQVLEPIKVVETLKPVSVKSPEAWRVGLRSGDQHSRVGETAGQGATGAARRGEVC